jgi:hypothetical protein|tara:strand:- start:309 stop:434 length:126 start_codon:yes stop_codon:yes gene_type:complete
MGIFLTTLDKTRTVLDNKCTENPDDLGCVAADDKVGGAFDW